MLNYNCNIVVIIQTVSDFTPDAVDKLLGSFNRCPVFVECRFIPAKQHFVLEGDGKIIEFALCEFMDIMHSMAVDEATKQQPELIQRSKASNLNNIPIRWTENSLPELKQWRAYKPQGSTLVHEFKHSTIGPNSMFCYNLVEYWQAQATPQEFSLMLNLEGSPTILEQLCRLCDCAIFPDWAQRIVKIRANNQNVLDIVLKKLCKVQELFMRRFTPITSHLIYAEDKSQFHLRFVPLSKQVIKERTTLFDNLSKWNSVQTNMLFSVRLMEYDYESESYKGCRLETGIVPSAYKTPEHHDWKDYVFHSREVELSSRLRSGRFDEILDVRRIQPEDFVCVYHAQPLHPGAPLESATSLDVEDSFGRVEGAKRHPRPKALKEEIMNEMKIFTPKRPASSLSLSSMPEFNHGSFLLTHAADIKSSCPQPSNYAFDNIMSVSQPVIDLGHIPSNCSSLFQSASRTVTSSCEQRHWAYSKMLLDPSDGLELGSRPSASDDNNLSNLPAYSRRPREQKSAQVHVTIERSSTPTAGDERIRSITLDARSSKEIQLFNEVTNGLPLESVIAIGQPGSTTFEHPSAVPISWRGRDFKPLNNADDSGRVPVESVEPVSEAHTRKVIGTINQKKPKLSPYRDNVADRLRRYNAQRMNETFFEAFEYASGWCGEIVLEAKLGRLIFFDIPRNIAKRDIEWQQWDQLMCSPETAFKTIFTKILTTQHFDVEFLRDLKLSGGERMFSKAPISRRLTYEFELEQKNAKSVLSVDGETFIPTLYGEQKCFGAVNMANPLRSWDFRVDLIGKTRLDINNDLCVWAIYNSIACSGGKGPPDLTFVIDEPSVSVRRILLKCETKYTVYLERLRNGVPMQLVMTEVQELHISKNKKIDKMYRAFAKAKNDMRREARLHWTCSVIPIEANSLLQQNEKLELGEDADWTVEEVLRLQEHADGMLLSCITNILNQIVSRIDDIGSTNIAFV
ncbi:hypothetical protein K440DRAFT_661566 [Wilcoxina mikolae CBS 423.85]|nr:hypothetical protein K440DRAFT_661566 [Wilcoxina mikolae CBS 423.85]